MTILLASLTPILIQTPVYLVLLVGIGIALARWGRHPRVSLLAVIGLLGVLIVDIAVIFLQVGVNTLLPARDILGALRIVGLCGSLGHAVLWGVILAAIFGGRKNI